VVVVAMAMAVAAMAMVGGWEKYCPWIWSHLHRFWFFAGNGECSTNYCHPLP
jgi:peptidoglycan/LPS O-acetylase OafA/YrhL